MQLISIIIIIKNKNIILYQIIDIMRQLNFKKRKIYELNIKNLKVTNKNKVESLKVKNKIK